jgi:hypothetical protein
VNQETFRGVPKLHEMLLVQEIADYFDPLSFCVFRTFKLLSEVFAVEDRTSSEAWNDAVSAGRIYQNPNEETIQPYKNV